MKHIWVFSTFCALGLAGSFICYADEQKGESQSEPKTIAVTMKSLSYDPKKPDSRRMARPRIR